MYIYMCVYAKGYSFTYIIKIGEITPVSMNAITTERLIMTGTMDTETAADVHAAQEQ